MHVLFRARLLIALIVIRGTGATNPARHFTVRELLPENLAQADGASPAETGRGKLPASFLLFEGTHVVPSRELLELILHLARQFSLPLEQ